MRAGSDRDPLTRRSVLGTVSGICLHAMGAAVLGACVLWSAAAKPSHASSRKST